MYSNDFYQLYNKGQEDSKGVWKSWQFTAEKVRPDMKEEIRISYDLHLILRHLSKNIVLHLITQEIVCSITSLENGM